ncbi:hypothetical protein Tco_1325157 [Tanacetum coccineum]
MHKEFMERQDAKGKSFNERATELDDRLSALDVEFDIKLFANMLKAVAVKRWVVDHGSRFSLAIDEEQCLGLEARVVHGKTGRDSKDIEAYCAEAKDKYEAAVKDLVNIPFLLLESLEPYKDSAMKFLILQSRVTLRPYSENPWGCDITLHEALAASRARLVVGTSQPSSLALENEALVVEPTVVIDVASLRFAALKAKTIIPALVIDSTSLTLEAALEGSAPMVVVSQEQPLPSLAIKSQI